MAVNRNNVDVKKGSKTIRKITRFPNRFQPVGDGERLRILRDKNVSVKERGENV